MPRRVKLVLLGDSTVGKSSICERFAHNTFTQEHSTIGASFQSMRCDNNVRIDMWDTAGQERFASILPMYYRDADIIVVVFDVTNKDYEKKLHYYVTLLEVSKYSIIIVGNKIDLISKIEENILYDDLQRYKRYANVHDIMFTSAKTNENIEKVKAVIASLGMNISQTEPISKSIALSMPTAQEKTHYICCN
jgi:Ras-related protein Rab-5C